MNSRINEIWTILGKTGNLREGIERIRYAEAGPAAIYIGYKTPEMFPVFSLSIPKKDLIRIASTTNYRSLRLDITADEIKKDNVFINLLLTEKELTGVFNILIDDFIYQLNNAEGHDEQVRVFFDHFFKWQKLFDDIPAGVLSEEARRGLFGELVFLKKWIENENSPEVCLNGWQGPDKAVHDFKYGMTAVEVKSTVSTSHQKLQINNERQLDDSHLNNLFVFYLSLDQRYTAGLTLENLIAEIYESMGNDYHLCRLLDLKLILSGYFEHNSEDYADTGYFIREARFFKVADGFPCIREHDLHAGIGEVKYTVSIDVLSSFETEEKTVFTILTQKANG
jgi:hypothetical protein